MSESNNNFKTIAIIIILLLLGLNIYQVWNKSNLEKRNLETTQAYNEEVEAKSALNETYYESLAELEELRSTDKTLNDLIDKQKEELKKQKNKISRLLKNKKNLSDAKLQIAEMESIADGYISQINALRQQNAQLADQNTQLSSDKTMLQQEIEYTTQAKVELEAANTSLEVEKTALETNNESLSKKVNKASVIRVTELTVSGWGIRSSGKAVSRRKAKNIDRLKICFRANENKITDKGREKFYVRIISPNGETLAIEDLGSGQITLEDGKSVRYTALKQFDYANVELYTCLHWEPKVAFAEGEYTVEVYNKNVMTASEKFKLK